MTANAIAPARAQAQLTQAGTGFVALPAASDPLDNPTAGVIITADGDLGVVLADGTDNDSALIAVTAGMILTPLQAIAVSANNTAGVLGLN